MKTKDVLLERWEAVIAQRPAAPAIFNTGGECVRTFRQVDDRAHDFESKIDNLAAGTVLAVQIGNHEDWPSVLIACLRCRVVLVPLEQSITDQQRDAALKVCNAVAVVSAVPSGFLDVLRLRTAASTVAWGNNPPSLLKLTSGTTAAPRA